MDLYQLISKLDSIEQLNEEPIPMNGPVDVPDPKPTMNVNMAAQGSAIKDLLKLLSDIESTEIQGLDNIIPSNDNMDDGEMEAYANEPDPEEKDIDYMTNKLAGGMNKPKDTFDVVSKGDNPMQAKKKTEESIRQELLKSLAEYKGN
jgi:hypothetical protein